MHPAHRSVIVGLPILGLFLYSGGMLAPQECGQQAGVKRVLREHRGGALVFPNVSLVQIDSVLGRTRLVVRVVHTDGSSVTFHQSLDGGTCWSDYSDTMPGATNLPVWSENPQFLLLGTSDPQAILQHDRVQDCRGRLSTDGGSTWTGVEPATVEGRPVRNCRVVAVGGARGERVYSYIQDAQNEGLWVSHDFGRTYSFLSPHICYCGESVADPRRLYGHAGSILHRSDDGGRSWVALEASRSLFQPAFRDPVDLKLRTWNESGRGTEDGYPFPIEQIQTDPRNRDVLYVLTKTGLCRSIDAGVSFVLLPLGSRQMRGVSRIAVDPIDGRFLFAQGWGGLLYRSDNRGCTWRRIDIPLK